MQPGFGPQLSAGVNAPATDAPPDVMTVRAKLTFLFGKRANVYGEGEQDVRSSARRVAAIGTQLLVSDRVKLYGRHEFISSLDGPYALTEGQRSYNTVFGVASSYMKDGDVFSEYRLADAISGREAEAAIGLRNQWTLAEGVRLSTGFERLAFDRRSRAARPPRPRPASSTPRAPDLKGTGRLEWRKDSSSDSWLSTVGFAQKLSRNWTMLARNYYQLTVPEGAPNQVQDRFSIGAAYRDTTANRLNLLTRYEFRVEDTPGLLLALGTATNRQVQVVSTHADVHPAACVDVLGPARGEVRRRSNGGQPWPIRHPAGLRPRRLRPLTTLGHRRADERDVGRRGRAPERGGRRSRVPASEEPLALGRLQRHRFCRPRSRVIELHHARDVPATPHEVR